MRTQPRAETEPLRFRASTLDEAVEMAEQSLGARTRVVAANHIRRGGIGGFFASDLGVEVSVVLEDETVEEALGRIVEETAAQEREKWLERGDARESERSASPTFADALHKVDRQTAMPIVDRFLPMPSVAAATQAASTPHAVGADASPADRACQTSIPTRPPTQLASRMERIEAAFASLRASTPAPTRTAVSAPTRRQVELAVAAADQLIDTISRRGAPQRLSVRVVLHGSNGNEVEAHAQWDPKAES